MKERREGRKENSQTSDNTINLDSSERTCNLENWPWCKHTNDLCRYWIQRLLLVIAAGTRRSARPFAQSVVCPDRLSWHMPHPDWPSLQSQQLTPRLGRSCPLRSTLLSLLFKAFFEVIEYFFTFETTGVCYLPLEIIYMRYLYYRTQCKRTSQLCLLLQNIYIEFVSYQSKSVSVYNQWVHLVIPYTFYLYKWANVLVIIGMPLLGHGDSSPCVEYKWAHVS